MFSSDGNKTVPYVSNFKLDVFNKVLMTFIIIQKLVIGSKIARKIARKRQRMDNNTAWQTVKLKVKKVQPPVTNALILRDFAIGS